MTVLTKPDILAGIANGTILVDPAPEFIGPNSIDLRLHSELKLYIDNGIQEQSKDGRWVHAVAPLDAAKDNPTRAITIPEHGFVLEPGELYLGSTIERTYTPAHCPKIGGRSSTGRLGITIHQTAGFGDVGFNGQWTLEITVTRRVRIYAGMRICQLWLFTLSAQLSKEEMYKGRYQDQSGAVSYRGHIKGAS